MDESISYLPSVIALIPIFLIALYLTLSRPEIDPSAFARRRLSAAAFFAIVAQTFHFIEELSGGFGSKLPEALGLPPMNESFFVSFNLAWIFVWVVSVWGLRSGHSVALAPLWFLGLAEVLNSIAHPLLAIRTGGYFPGLYTVPLVGIAGILLVRELYNATSSG